MSETVTLDAESVEAIARRVAELVAPTPSERLMTAAEVAERFNVSRDYVYDHADDLGAQPLSDGPKARLRFDPAKVADALTPRSFAAPEQPARRQPNRKPAGAVDLLPVGRPT